jgi:quercetin dioxygenase-like cupin family protein
MKLVTVDPTTWQEGDGYRKNRLLTADDLRQPGALLQVVSIPPGSHVPDHHHRTSIEVYHVLRGTCEIAVNDDLITIGPGDTMLMEPGDVHALTNTGDELFELLVFKTNAADGDTVWK